MGLAPSLSSMVWSHGWWSGTRMAASADIMGRNSRNFPGTALRPSASPWLTASSEGVSPMCRMAAITAGSVTQICLVFRFSFLVLLWHLWQFPESKRMFSGFPQIPRGRWSCSHQRGSIRSQSASRGLTSNATCDMWYLYTVRVHRLFRAPPRHSGVLEG